MGRMVPSSSWWCVAAASPRAKLTPARAFAAAAASAAGGGGSSAVNTAAAADAPAEDLFMRGFRELEAGRPTAAAPLLQEAAALGHVKATSLLGCFYLRGMGGLADMLKNADPEKMKAAMGDFGATMNGEKDDEL